MGGTVSIGGADNDELVDNLIEANYIRTPLVAKVFRTVDRAFYFLPEFRYSAYRDFAWKHGNLHLSAPCIYSEVLEHLNLKPGQSFLNIGSGTGYLSTMAGLILGTYGVNHGLEFKKDVVKYAKKKLEEFKNTCNALDVFEFCEPEFKVGNAYDLQCDRRYDRMYCGAACPVGQYEYFKRYLKINGILIVPCEEDLLKIVRNSENSWDVTSVFCVSFSTLQMSEKFNITVTLPFSQPLSLQEICRSKIRCILREVVEEENPDLTNPVIHKRTKNDPRFPSRHRDIMSYASVPRSYELENLIFRCSTSWYQDFISSHQEEIETTRQGYERENSESGFSENDTEDSNLNNSDITNTNNTGESSDMNNTQNKRIELASEVSDSSGSEIDFELFDSPPLQCDNYHRLHALCAFHGEDIDEDGNILRLSSDSNQNAKKKADEENDKPKKLLKREKLDSGISEESDDGNYHRRYHQSSSSESAFSEPMEVSSNSTTSKRNTTSSLTPEDYFAECAFNVRKNRGLPPKKGPTLKYVPTDHKDQYRVIMEKKIIRLPLPHRLQLYLNLDREFQVATQ